MAKSRDEIVNDPDNLSLLDIPKELLLPTNDSKDSETSITSAASMIVASPYRAALGAGDLLIIDEMNPTIDSYVDVQSKKTGLFDNNAYR